MWLIPNDSQSSSSRWHINVPLFKSSLCVIFTPSEGHHLNTQSPSLLHILRNCNVKEVGVLKAITWLIPHSVTLCTTASLVCTTATPQMEKVDEGRGRKANVYAALNAIELLAMWRRDVHVLHRPQLKNHFLRRDTA